MSPKVAETKELSTYNCVYLSYTVKGKYAIDEHPRDPTALEDVPGTPGSPIEAPNAQAPRRTEPEPTPPSPADRPEGSRRQPAASDQGEAVDDAPPERSASSRTNGASGARAACCAMVGSCNR